MNLRCAFSQEFNTLKLKNRQAQSIVKARVIKTDRNLKKKELSNINEFNSFIKRGRSFSLNRTFYVENSVSFAPLSY